MATLDVPAGFSLEDVLRAGAEAEDAPDAKTVDQLAAACGRDVKWVRKRLAGLIATGRCEVLRVRRTRIDGQPYQAPAYRLAGVKLD